MASGYVAGQGAPTGQTAGSNFATGIDLTGLGVSAKEYSKQIPLGVETYWDFSAQRGGLAGPGNGPAMGQAQITGPRNVTFGDLIQQLSTMDGPSLEALQTQMYQGKMYSRGYYRKG